MPQERSCIECNRAFTVDKPSRKQRYCGHRCAFKVNGHKARAAAATPEATAKRVAKMRRDNGNYVKTNYRHEHRVVMEKALGRRLGPDEIVHHRDEVKSNNSLENLELMDRATHGRIHNLGRKRVPKTHCKYGHELTTENTMITSSGARRCLTCERKYQAEWQRNARRRKKAAAQ